MRKITACIVSAVLTMNAPHSMAASLQDAAEKCDANTIHALIKAGADVDKKDELALTPLSTAVINGCGTNVILTLIRSGANLDVPDIEGATALERAVGFGNYAVVRLLIDKGANVSSKDKQGWTVLHYWTRSDGNPGIAQLLIKKGANISASDGFGNTPLHFLADSPTDPNMGLLLVKEGADINARNNSGDTPLHLSSLAGNYEFAALLIKSGADINAKNQAGEIPLHSAAKREGAGLIPLLVTNNAVVNTKNIKGETPLHAAALQDSGSVAASILLEAGADENIKDNNGKTALEIADKLGHKETVRILKTPRPPLDVRIQYTANLDALTEFCLKAFPQLGSKISSASKERERRNKIILTLHRTHEKYSVFKDATMNHLAQYPKKKLRGECGALPEDLNKKH